MKTIEITATVTAERTLIVPLPLDLSPGEHRIVVVIDEKPIASHRGQPLRLSAYPVGLVTENMTFRREDLYGD